MWRRDRNDSLNNGSLMALGSLAIVNNGMVHWPLELRRVNPGPEAIYIGAAPVSLGVGLGLLAAGLWQEVRVRRTLRSGDAT